MAGGRLRFDGRVAVVTGAGGGLGREYALLLADHGAAVVVNDLGVTRSGEGKSANAADAVVQEIRSKGGKAVADYNSVEEGEKIVKTAVDNFNRIDILINNAGILRDKSFLNISVEDWDLVHRIHLRGSFLVTKAAWPYFRKQKYGRIIMTSSGAGIYGNFGQSNYGSAKLGLLGLSNTLSKEGEKYNITCNTVVPLAASRLTEDVMPPEMFQQLKPEYVAPLVAWLCHEKCPENGGVFEAAGGWIGKYCWKRSVGKAFIPPSSLTPESVRDNWPRIIDMAAANSPSNIQEQTGLLVEALSGQDTRHIPEHTETSTVPGVYEYNQDSAILYALGVGMSTSDPDHLKFLYENSDDFSVLPTFGTIPCLMSIFESPHLQDQLTKLKVDLTKLLHGEQYLEMLHPLPPSGVLKSEVRIADVLDKGSGAVVIVDVDTFDETGKKIMYNQCSTFFVGAGKFGGKRSSDKAKNIVPNPSRAPDAVIEEKTSVDQAALYRLCGDKNPIHIDPSFAAVGGFSQPIMHGLCSLGYATRHVLRQYSNNDVKNFKSIMARFTGPILPGQTIRTEMWKEGSRVHFQSSVAETGKPIISGGYIDLLQNLTENKMSQSSFNKSELTSQNLNSDLIFAEMSKRLADIPDLSKKIQAVYQWDITKNGKVVSKWTLDLKSEKGSIYRGESKTEKPGCTLSIDDDDLLSLVTGKLDAQKAFLTGKLKIKGNILLTQKLRPVLQSQTKSVPKPDVKSVPSTDNKSKDGLKCLSVFADMDRRIKKNPSLVEKVQTIYQWNILKSGSVVAQWTLDLKNGTGAVYQGPPKSGKADCTLILEDDLLADIMAGKADPQKAFMSGKLKITGNVLASQKLQDVWDPDLDANSNISYSASPSKISVQPSPPPEPPTCVKSDFVFEIFAERLVEEPEIAKKMKVVFHWNIKQKGNKATEWTVDLKTGTGSIYKGSPKTEKADVIITMEDEDVIKLMLGLLNPQRAFMTGKLKIKGNIMLTQKLNQLWQEVLKSGKAVELPLLAPILSDKPLDPSMKSDSYFVHLAKKVARMPELIPNLQTVYEWHITKDGTPATHWTLDLKKDKGAIHRGPSKGEKATCSLTVDDDDFANLITGRLNGQQALSAGKVKVLGDKRSAQKLMEIFKHTSKL